uniref:Uncharacterized protein n=1 Tax=Ixodes ricinus TaxID=34613 RepID=A0A6B0U9A5_IXORI
MRWTRVDILSAAFIYTHTYTHKRDPSANCDCRRDVCTCAFVLLEVEPRGTDRWYMWTLKGRKCTASNKPGKPLPLPKTCVWIDHA